MAHAVIPNTIASQTNKHITLTVLFTTISFPSKPFPSNKKAHKRCNHRPVRELQRIWRIPPTAESAQMPNRKFARTFMTLTSLCCTFSIAGIPLNVNHYFCHKGIVSQWYRCYTEFVKIGKVVGIWPFMMDYRIFAGASCPW